MIGAPNKEKLAYIIGIAIGDGNLSNPNGRATRLRITCDIKYPHLIENITHVLQELFPNNKVSLIHRKDNCIDVSCYSNQLEELLGWKVGQGSKYEQNVSIPEWIMQDKESTISCLRGLFQTDGSIYEDRGYPMVNFVTIIPKLAEAVFNMIINLGFKPNIQRHIQKNRKIKHTIRISKNTKEFISILDLIKN